MKFKLGMSILPQKICLILLLLLIGRFSQAQDLTINCLDNVKIEDLETYFDEYEIIEIGHDKSIQLSKDFNLDFFKCNDVKKLKSILVNIEITTDGSYVIDKNKTYKPEYNEILFLIEDEDNDVLGGSQQIKFNIGKGIRNAILDGDLNPMLILEFLKCKIIRLNNIAEDAYFLEAFENEINK